MDDKNLVGITVWMVGWDEDDAFENFPFHSFESAAEYASYEKGMKVYSLTAWLDKSTIAEDEDYHG